MSEENKNPEIENEPVPAIQLQIQGSRTDEQLEEWLRNVLKAAFEKKAAYHISYNGKSALLNPIDLCDKDPESEFNRLFRYFKDE